MRIHGVYEYKTEGDGVGPLDINSTVLNVGTNLDYGVKHSLCELPNRAPRKGALKDYTRLALPGEFLE